MFCNIIDVFTDTFEQFKASLLNKSIHFLQNNNNNKKNTNFGSILSLCLTHKRAIFSCPNTSLVLFMSKKIQILPFIIKARTDSPVYCRTLQWNHYSELHVTHDKHCAVHAVCPHVTVKNDFFIKQLQINPFLYLICTDSLYFSMSTSIWDVFL